MAAYSRNVRFVPFPDSCAAANLCANRVLVDIFLLGVVKTHESLNCFDNALRVSDQIMVCIWTRQAIGEPS
jgi:hypothetical protein